MVSNPTLKDRYAQGAAAFGGFEEEFPFEANPKSSFFLREWVQETQ